MLQSIIDAIDEQIQKTRSPVVNTLLAVPIFMIVAIPVAFITGAFVLLFLGTTGQVGQQTTTPGWIAGIAVLLVFTLWAAYGTYTSNKDLQDNSSL